MKTLPRIILTCSLSGILLFSSCAPPPSQELVSTHSIDKTVDGSIQNGVKTELYEENNTAKTYAEINDSLANTVNHVDQFLTSGNVSLKIDAEVSIPVSIQGLAEYEILIMPFQGESLLKFLFQDNFESIEDKGNNRYSYYLSENQPYMLDYDTEKGFLKFLTWRSQQSTQITSNQAEGCNLASDDAVKTTMEFMNVIGLENMAVTEVSTYAPGTLETGFYIVTAEYELDNIPVNGAMTYFNGKKNQNQCIYAFITLDDTGIVDIRMNCFSFKETKEVRSIISLDEAISLVDKNLDRVVQEDNVEVYKIAFEYVLGGLSARPAWHFYARNPNDDYPWQIYDIFVDANTGSVTN